jgi:hypothetical protein
MNDARPTLSPLLARLDAALLAVLLVARLRIDTLADGVALGLRQQDVARQPFLGSLLPKPVMTLLAQQGLVDPIGLLLIVGCLGCLVIYLIVAESGVQGRDGVSVGLYRVKLALIWAIILLGVFAPTIKLMLLRQGSGPASYSHDGGVIQTEATINFLYSGRNPYVEDYTQTPMAEWGINEFRTALYHYPYLPWTFLFSAPFKPLATALFGWFDERMVYLLLFALTLALLPRLARGQLSKLLLVMLVGLNPIMGNDVIYGQNDSFVLAWIVLSLWCWARGREGARAAGAFRGWRLASAAAFGLACASKPTAWFMAPFYLLLLAQEGGIADTWGGWRKAKDRLWQAARLAWPAAAVGGLIILPYFIWNPGAMIDDVWRWSSGTSPTAYQIWGWGASNLTLAFGWVTSRFSYWPFWLPELIVGAPLMGWLLWRQWRANTASAALWGYGVFTLAFFYVSRFLNENYLGYVLALLALGLLVDVDIYDGKTRASDPAA